VTPRATLPTRETLTVEFKRDRADRPVSNDDLVLAVVCLANADGGALYLGVEDDGRVTGAAPGRDADTLCAVIAGRTTPRLAVTAEALDVDGERIIRIDVPRAPGPVMRNDGTYQRRQLKQDGTPECVAMWPHEVTLRARSAGAGDPDPSATPVHGATAADLDPVERARLRRVIDEQPNADKRLLGMTDEAFDDALTITAPVDGGRVPTLTGLLLLGTERTLRRLVPQHEVALQVFRGTEVLVNRIERPPLLAAVDDLNRQFATLPAEGELAVGLRRLPIPSIDGDAFREAVLNALVHRDYGRVGTVRVAFKEDELEVSSPGGLVPGVTVDRLLTTPPTPRNRALAHAFMRLGLVERSARGVDRIYEGQVAPVPTPRRAAPRAGRPATRPAAHAGGAGRGATALRGCCSPHPGRDGAGRTRGATRAHPRPLLRAWSALPCGVRRQHDGPHAPTLGRAGSRHRGARPVRWICPTQRCARHPPADRRTGDGATGATHQEWTTRPPRDGKGDVLRTRGRRQPGCADWPPESPVNTGGSLGAGSESGYATRCQIKT